MGRCKWLTLDYIERRATEFLEKYNPSLKIPVLIEEIIEFDLRINIVPFPFLYKDHGISSFLTIDRKEIWVDQIQFEQYEQKYRFSLAHEIGHFILHGSIIEEGFNRIKSTGYSIETYIEWFNTLSSLDIQRMDFQSNYFASYLLMPNPILKNVFSETFESLIGNKDFRDVEKQFIFQTLVEVISKEFNVSLKSMALRIRDDNNLQGILSELFKSK